MEPVFHPDSYGYRPGKSALDAVGMARTRCWAAAWVIDLDITSFFDSLDHELVERAVAHHTDIPWLRLYIARWLRAPVQRPDGTLEQRTRGTPQGGVVSPLLANLFLHYAFDVWMQRHFPGVRFERYADDAIVHCRTEQEARKVLAAIRGRFAQCRLELHPLKTRIVYCKRDGRPGDYANVAFDFLGYTFQPRLAKNRQKECFVGFLPAISAKAATAIRATIREWRLASTRNNQSLEDLAQLVNPVIRGWMNYYVLSVGGIGGSARRVTPAERFLLLGRTLGRALAHEIGHYLLKSKEHTTNGLMKGRRTIQEFIDAERRGFEVDTAQREAIVRRIRELTRI